LQLDLDGNTCPPFVFKLTFSLEEQFTKAVRSMAEVEKLLATGIEKDFTIVCKPNAETKGEKNGFLVWLITN
jgi:hypothetical protein